MACPAPPRGERFLGDLMRSFPETVSTFGGRFANLFSTSSAHDVIGGVLPRSAFGG